MEDSTKLFIIVVGLLLVAYAFHHLGHTKATQAAHLAMVAHATRPLNSMDISMMEQSKANRFSDMATKSQIAATRAGRDAEAALQEAASLAVSKRQQEAHSAAISLGESSGRSEESRMEPMIFRRRVY